mgnify:CR=1 FL=1
MGKYQETQSCFSNMWAAKKTLRGVALRIAYAICPQRPAKADVAKIEALKSAKGTFTQAGQFQVIIGNTVSDFYNDFIAVSGIDGVSKDAVKSAAKQNQTTLQKIMSALADREYSVQPLSGRKEDSRSTCYYGNFLPGCL